MAVAQIHSAIPLRVHEDAPPSPTLTNPDMILPTQMSHASPGPIASSPTLHSDLSLTPSTHYRSHSSESRSSEQPSAEVGVARAVMMPFRVKPPLPTTIATPYKSYEHGAPLSDIGEEESTPRSKKTSRSRTPSPGRARSPPRPAVFGPPLRHKNRTSISSDMSNGSDLGSWEDFDSSKMMNARLAADVANAEDDLTDIEGPESKRNSVIIPPAEDEMTALNQKAEKILADAKKRLTLMEDNLSKARNSILLSPRTSPVVGHQPVGGLYRSISQGGDRRLGPGYVRKSKSLYPVVRNLQTGHLRGLSDNSASYDDLSRNPQIRSASALEFNRRMDAMLTDEPPAGYPNHSPSSSRSFNSPMRPLEEEIADGSPSTHTASPRTPTASVTRGLGITTSSPTTPVNPQRSSASSKTHGRSSSQTSTQSTRELRDQMSDLKNRIADLKQKAQSDSLRRRSQQTLRTPSPFTHAPEQWYAAAPEYQKESSPINSKAGLGWSPNAFNNSPRSPASPHDSAFGEGGVIHGITPVTVRTDMNTPHLVKTALEPPQARLSGGVPASFAQGSHYEDAEEDLDDGEGPSEEEQIYLNEALEESLQDAEPDIPIMLDQEYLQPGPQAERHEDRVDAFDYENMILHSALGNYSQNHGEEESDTDSEDSVETRRAIARTPSAREDNDDDDDEEGDCDSETASSSHEKISVDSAREVDAEEPPTPKATVVHSLRPPLAPWMKAARSNSMDSVSTAATYATAAEGQDEEEDEQPIEILNWGSVPSGFASPPAGGALWSTPAVFQSAESINEATRPVSRGKGSQFLVNGAARSAKVASTSPPQMPSTGAVQAPVPSVVQIPQTAQVQQPANTEILMASLITLADPTFQMPDQGTVFADVDKQLVIALLRSVGMVCGNTLTSTQGPKGEAERMMWRRRLEVARAVLERGSHTS